MISTLRRPKKGPGRRDSPAVAMVVCYRGDPKERNGWKREGAPRSLCFSASSALKTSRKSRWCEFSTAHRDCARTSYIRFTAQIPKRTSRRPGTASRMRGKQVKDYLGQEAVRAWLIIAAIFVTFAVVGLLGEWDGLTRTAIIGASISLSAGLMAIAACLVRIRW